MGERFTSYRAFSLDFFTKRIFEKKKIYKNQKMEK